MSTRRTTNEIIPANIFHPGMVLCEKIECRKLTCRTVAEDMGIPATVLSEIISGKRNITTALAISHKD